MVVYNFGQDQRTSQVERKTKCSKKTKVGDKAVLWTALLINVTYISVVPFWYHVYSFESVGKSSVSAFN